MLAPTGALRELTDWVGGGPGIAFPDEPFVAGDLSRPDPGLSAWVTAVTPEADSFADPPSTLAALVGELVELAGRSGTAATWVGELILGEYARRGLAAAGSELATSGTGREGQPVRCGVESGRGDGTQRWLIAPPATSGAVVVLPGAERSRALLVDDLRPAGRGGLIGLEGLELFDLAFAAGGGVVDPALTRDGTDALVALGAIVDASVDLGLCIGFVGRIAAYVTAVGDDAASVEPVALERLGEAYAVLGSISEGLAELVADWPRSGAGSRSRELRRRAGELRRLGRDPEASLLSDLFELAGARATSGRFGLDAPWRDFIARQAIHPIDAVLTPTNEQEI